MSGAAPLSSTQRLHSALGDIPTDEFEAALDADRQPPCWGWIPMAQELRQTQGDSSRAPAGPLRITERAKLQPPPKPARS